MVSGLPVREREPAHVLVVAGTESVIDERLSRMDSAWRVTTDRGSRADIGESVDCLVVDTRTVDDRHLQAIVNRADAPVLAVVTDRDDAVIALDNGVDDVFISDGEGDPTLLESRIQSVLESGPRLEREGKAPATDSAAANRRERELGRQRERLAVLHRVLRHDVRTSANLLLGTADFVREGIGRPDQRADEIEETATRIVRLSDTVRRLTDAIGDDTPTAHVDLTALLRNRQATLADRFPSATVTTSIRSGVTVRTDAHLEAAFDQLLENAAVHADDPALGVRLDIETIDAVVTISDNGPGIPADELEVLEDGTETPLDHSSGLGLWVSTWIIDAAGGSISFDSDDNGTTVTVRLPLAADDGNGTVNREAADVEEDVGGRRLDSVSNDS